MSKLKLALHNFLVMPPFLSFLCKVWLSHKLKDETHPSHLFEEDAFLPPHASQNSAFCWSNMHYALTELKNEELSQKLGDIETYQLGSCRRFGRPIVYHQASLTSLFD